MPFRLDKDRRIVKSSDYRRVYDAGGKLVGRTLILFYRPADAMKVGVTVSGKVGNAVVRNKAKRRIKAALGAELEVRLPMAEMVFVALRRISEAGYADIQSDVRVLLTRVKT